MGRSQRCGVNRVRNNGYGRRCDNGAGRFPYCILCCIVFNYAARVDKTGSVLKTFNDYSDETEINFIRLNIDSGNRWIDRAVKDISLPPQMLFAAIYRNDETIIPNGETVIYEGDTIILGAPSHGINGDVRFREISANDRKNWRGKSMAEIEFPDGYLVIMIKRGDDVVIPVGSTIIEKNDELVLVSK